MTEMQIRNLFSLEGKTALVTGGCYGIGFAIARALHAAGAKVAFFATSDASVEKALASYAAEGITDVRGYPCDVTDEARAQKRYPLAVQLSYRQEAEAKCEEDGAFLV